MSFCYDALNRLTAYALAGLCTGAKTVAYDALGNITTKSDTGAYSYPVSGPSSVRPHAVSSITGTVNGVVNPNYAYDANGNMTCVNPGASGCAAPARTIAYNASNMTTQVVQASGTLTLSYDPDHMRVVQTEPLDTTAYHADHMAGASEEFFTPTVGGSLWHDYLTVDGQVVAVRSAHSTTVTWAYFVNDPLGSVSILTDDTGAVTKNFGGQSDMMSAMTSMATALENGAAGLRGTGPASDATGDTLTDMNNKSAAIQTVPGHPQDYRQS